MKYKFNENLEEERQNVKIHPSFCYKDSKI